MIKTPNIPKETRGCFLRIFRGEPETKSSRFRKSNDYKGAGVREADQLPYVSGKH